MLIHLLLLTISWPPLETEPVQKALAKMENFNAQQWSFSVSRLDGKRSKREKHDPCNSSIPWQLLTIDGEVPTASQSKKYLEEHQKDETKEDDSENNSFSTVIDESTLKLISQSKEEHIYSFRPTADDPKAQKIMTKILGKIYIQPSNNTIKKIEMKNIGVIKPMLGVKITKMLTIMNFHTVDNTTLIDKIVVEVKGKAFVFKTINQYNEAIYSNYSICK